MKYQWYRDGTPIAGATSLTHLVVAADQGSWITLGVTASRSGYATTTMTSAGVLAGLALTSTPVPTVQGGSGIGATLTVTTGDWKPSPATLTYQWYRDGVAIDGAVLNTYTVASEDSGHEITVEVTGTALGYVEVTETSSPISIE
jgi:hypothetical protein